MLNSEKNIFSKFHECTPYFLSSPWRMMHAIQIYIAKLARHGNTQMADEALVKIDFERWRPVQIQIGLQDQGTNYTSGVGK